MNEVEQANREFLNALNELRNKVQDVHLSSLQARDALSKAINNSNLKSTLSLLKEDIGLRRLLELTR